MATENLTDDCPRNEQGVQLVCSAPGGGVSLTRAWADDDVGDGLIRVHIEMRIISQSTSAPTEQSDPTTDGAIAPGRPAENAFIQHPNGRWEVRFGGERGDFGNLYGIRYLAALFEHPHKPITPADLNCGYGERNAHPAWPKDDRSADDSLTVAGSGEHLSVEEGLSRHGNSSYGYNPHENLKLAKLIAHIESEMNEQRERTPADDKEEREQQALLQKYSDRLSRLRLQLYRQEEERKLLKTNVNVAKNLRDAVKQMRARGLIKLAQHVKVAIGHFEVSVLTYSPQRGVKWRVHWHTPTRN